MTTEKTVLSVANNGIGDPEYIENPEMPIDGVERMKRRFDEQGLLLPEGQRLIYEGIRDRTRESGGASGQYTFLPRMVDVGCGCGIGSNILSQAADFIWGVDSSAKAIQFARQAFARAKNRVYWSPQVTFDIVDVLAEDREVSTFDIVVCVEVIEHVAEYWRLLDFLRRCGRRDAHYYVSTPNRSAWNGLSRSKRPANPHHVREWTAMEFSSVLGQQFEVLGLFDVRFNSVATDTTSTPVIAECRT